MTIIRMLAPLWIGFTIVALATNCLATESNDARDAGNNVTQRPLGPKYWVTDNTAADPPEIPLWPEGTPNRRRVEVRVESRAAGHRNRWVTGVADPTLTIYRAVRGNKLKSAVVVCPGGGYGGLAIDKEGHDVARWLNALGVTAAVLKYRHKEYGQPAPLEDAQRAIATLRGRSREFELDPGRIGVIGFSAGGHVASSVGTHFGDVEINGQTVSSRPDFMMLIYPVISMDQEITHAGSRVNLLGKAPDDELSELYSNDRQVTHQTPPTFLVHALDDEAVPIENSLRMYRALQQAQVPAELVVYETGGHGFGLGQVPGEACQWPARAEAWLARQGLTGGQ